MMRIFLLLPWLFQATAANQRDFTARLVATDVRFMRGSHLEADDSPTLPAYERQVRHNIRYLKDRGVTVEEGIWNHEVDERGAILEGALSGRQFLGLAMEALKAQFPDSTILAVNSLRHLNLTMGPMSFLGFPLKEGHGIVDALHRFLVRTGLPHSSHAFDIMAYLHATVSAGKKVLQLGGNRFQFMTAFLKYMDAQFWKPSDISGLAHSSSSPLPTRVSCVPCQDCKDGSGPSAPFTFPELVASQGDPSADAALAWLDAIPLKLLEEQNVSCQALRDELRRSRQENVDVGPAVPRVGPWSFPVTRWCTVYMGASYGSDGAYRASAERFGRLLAQKGIGLLYGGGNAGLMGAVADAVLREGGYVIGVRPAGNLLTAEHEHKDLSHMIFTKTMHERKQTMVDLADFLVALPGGLGTLDELADAVVLAHLGTHSKPVFLLNTNSFWTPLLKFLDNMAAARFLKVGRWDELVEVVESADELVLRLPVATGTPETVEAEAEALQATFLQLQVGTEITTFTEVASCPFEVGLLPALAIGCITSIVTALFGVHSRSVSSGRCIVDLFMLITVLAATSRMISVPDSHALSLALGQGASWSGLYLGISKWGDMIGNLICAFPLHYWPDFWRTSSRQAMMCGLGVMSVGSALCLVTLSQVGHVGSEENLKLAILLCVSRAVIGVGNGMVTQLVIVLLAKLTPAEDLPSEFQRAVFYVTVGTGLGPLAAAASYKIDVCQSSVPNPPYQFKTVGIVQLILLSSGLCVVMLFYPSFISSKDIQIASDQEAESTPVPLSKKLVILAGLVLCALRSFVAGSVEVGTPLLLEDRFAWSIASTGFITGLAFLMGLPVRLAQLTLGSRLSEVAWIRLLTIFASLGTLLLLRAASGLIPGGYALVLGDMIIFPCIYLSEGLTQGLMMRFVPHGGSNSFFEASSIALIMDMLINAFLGLGAVGARSIIEAGGERGQDFNAGMQLLCCLAFLLIFEAGMAGMAQVDKSK